MKLLLSSFLLMSLFSSSLMAEPPICDIYLDSSVDPTYGSHVFVLGDQKFHYGLLESAFEQLEKALSSKKCKTNPDRNCVYGMVDDSYYIGIRRPGIMWISSGPMLQSTAEKHLSKIQSLGLCTDVVYFE